MATLLGGLAFVLFLLAQIAAVAAVHAESKTRRTDAWEELRRDPRAKVMLASGS